MGDEPKVLMVGNVKFYQKDVKEYTVKKAGSENENTVILKDGTKIRFLDQKQDSNASIFMGYDMARNNAPLGVKFTNLSYGSVTGSPNRDYYYFDNCEMYVDVSKDDNSDEIKCVGHNAGNWPTLHLGNNDVSSTLNLSEAEFINSNEGFWLPDAEN